MAQNWAMNSIRWAMNSASSGADTTGPVPESCMSMNCRMLLHRRPSVLHEVAATYGPNQRTRCAHRRTERLCARSRPNRGLGFGLDVSSVDVLCFLKEGPPERRWCAGRRGVYYSGCCTTPGTPPNAVHREVRVECGAQLSREGRTKLGFGVGWGLPGSRHRV